MDNTESKNSRIMIAMLIALLLNLIMTAGMFGILLTSSNTMSSVTDSNSEEYEALPQGLATKEDRVQLFADFQLNYNSGDNEKLLSMFGEAYRLQISGQDYENNMKMLRRIASAIGDGAYSHYVFEKLGSGITKFELFYNINSPEGLRLLKIQLTQQGNDSYSIYGFKINTP